MQLADVIKSVRMFILLSFFEVYRIKPGVEQKIMWWQTHALDCVSTGVSSSSGSQFPVSWDCVRRTPPLPSKSTSNMSVSTSAWEVLAKCFFLKIYVRNYCFSATKVPFSSWLWRVKTYQNKQKLFVRAKKVLQKLQKISETSLWCVFVHRKWGHPLYPQTRSSQCIEIDPMAIHWPSQVKSFSEWVTCDVWEGNSAITPHNIFIYFNLLN